MERNPDDLLATAQLAFLYLERGNEAAAVELLERARNSADEDVAMLLAVLGYALGTYAAWACGLLMQFVAPVPGV